MVDVKSTAYMYIQIYAPQEATRHISKKDTQALNNLRLTVPFIYMLHGPPLLGPYEYALLTFNTAIFRQYNTNRLISKDEVMIVAVPELWGSKLIGWKEYSMRSQSPAPIGVSALSYN